MTPMRPERDARAAARAPGSTTPSTGIARAARSEGSATAEAVLHATTRRSISRATRNRAFRSEYCVTTSGDFEPYGTAHVPELLNSARVRGGARERAEGVRRSEAEVRDGEGGSESGGVDARDEDPESA